MPTCAIKVINCLIEGCERKAKTRGLCDPCYQSALTAVRKRKVTWDQLINMGLAKPATKVSTRGAGMFAVALAAKKASLLSESAPVDAEPLPPDEEVDCAFPPAPEADTADQANPLDYPAPGDVSKDSGDNAPWEDRVVVNSAT